MSLVMLRKLQETSSGEPISHVHDESVVSMKKDQDPLPEGAPPKPFIQFNHTDGTITFKLQDGPINQVGKNGCQVDDIIDVARAFIDEANTRFHCNQNVLTIQKLKEALMWQADRKKDREKRGVEGYNEV